MKVRVDEARCQGHTVCAMSAADIFELDDDDGHATALAGEVPVGREDAVRRAAASCPESAIEIF